MGALIHRVTTSSEGNHQGYLEAGTNAGHRCLNEAGVQLNQLGMLVNTGVFSDQHIQEPAYAALIQGRLQEVYDDENPGLFSTDIRDGVNGALMALRILDGFVKSRKIQWGLVVSGDAVWENMQSEGFHFSDIASAILIGKGSPGCGFQQYAREFYPAYMSDYLSYTNYADDILKTVTRQSDKYLEHCIECAQISIFSFLQKAQLTINDIDLLICSQSPDGFTAQLARNYHAAGVHTIETDQMCYSSGLGCALDMAFRDHLFPRAKRILFLTVGAGIVVNLAFYQN